MTSTRALFALVLTLLVPITARAQFPPVAAPDTSAAQVATTQIAVPEVAVAAKPDHRIKVTYTMTEQQWSKLGTPVVLTFDSGAEDTALFNLDYFLAGHAPQDATGHIWRSWLKPAPFGDPERSLRITWWHYKYADGTWWIAGAVLNDSVEAPIGRTRGKIEVDLCNLDGTVRERYPSGVVTISLQNGFAFSFGQPGRFMNFGAMRYFIANWGAAGDALPPERLFDPVPCPDRMGGATEWRPQWSPHSIVGNPKYFDTSDPRNPPIGPIIGDIEVSALYDDQTHAHFRECFRVPFETCWQAAERAGDRPLARKVLRAAYELSARQVGSWSPKLGPPYFADGRPAYLAGLNGWLLDAGVRYRLTATDIAALRAWIGHEGRPEQGKGDWQFTECFGQDSGKPTSENAIHWLELVAGQFRGLYHQPNAWDLEHGGAEAIAAAANLLADPLAMAHLHQWCEEYITNGIVKHSSRSTGWMMVTPLLGWLTFKDKPAFADDAKRYLEYARQHAQWAWQARIDETPYQGLITRNYERLPLDKVAEADLIGLEAAFQSAIALNAFCMGAQVDPDPMAQKLYLDLVEYTANLYLQPGIIQRPTPTMKGGILDSWSLLGPVPESEMPGKSVEERLRARSGSNAGVDWLADQGWAGPALAKAARVLKGAGRPSWEKIDKLAREIEGYQALVQLPGGTVRQPTNWISWGMHFEQAASYGWRR